MTLTDKIHELAKRYRGELSVRVEERLEEMANDDNRHYVLYNALGVNDDEGNAIDRYQNMGRFLYKYAGTFMEDVVILCFTSVPTFNQINSVGYQHPSPHFCDGFF